MLSFLCSNYRLSINIRFHLFTFLVVNIAIYVQQLYSTTGTGLAKYLWPTLISWAWLFDLDEQISFFIMFHPLENNLYSFAHVICSAREPFLFCEVTFRVKTRVLFPDHKEKRSFRCVYCKGKVILDLNSTTLGFVRLCQFVFLYPFLSTPWASFNLYVVSASTTQQETIKCRSGKKK